MRVAVRVLLGVISLLALLWLLILAFLYGAYWIGYHVIFGPDKEEGANE